MLVLILCAGYLVAIWGPTIGFTGFTEPPRIAFVVGGTANYNYNTPLGWRGSQQDTHETAAFILQTVYRSQLANLSWGVREATSYWDVTDV